MTCGGCMKIKHRGRISPAEAEQNPQIIEIRKGRRIRVQHIFPDAWRRLHAAESVQDNESIFFVSTNQLRNRQQQQVPGTPSSSTGRTLITKHGAYQDNTNHNSSSSVANIDATEPHSSTTSLSCTGTTSRISATPCAADNLTKRALETRHRGGATTTPSQASFYSAYGDRNTVIFFIHGVGGSSDLWHHQIEYFVKKGFEVVAPDLLGHGFSQAPHQSSAYTFHALADDMLALFDAFAKKRNILIGHSYGSSFCTIIARERSRKVTKMILIGGGGPIPLEPQTCQVFGLPECVLCCIKPIISDIFARRAFHTRRPRTGSEKQKAFDVPSYVLHAMMKGQHWMDGDEDYHLEIAVSVLLIYGMQDKFVSLEEEEWMQETIYACQLTTIEDAGHMVMVECPDKVNSLIHTFIMKDMMISHHQTQTSRTQPTHVTEIGPDLPQSTVIAVEDY